MGRSGSGAGEVARWSPMLQACRCSLVVSPGRPQVCRCLCRCTVHPLEPPGAPVLSDSGDFPALPSPLFFCSPLRLSQARLGCGWSAREGASHHLLRAALDLRTPFLLPLCVSSPSTRNAAAGANLALLWGHLCHVFLWSGHSGWWFRLHTSPTPRLGAVSAGRGRSISSLHRGSCSPGSEEGLLSPVSPYRGEKARLGWAPGEQVKAWLPPRSALSPPPGLCHILLCPEEVSRIFLRLG